MEQSLGKYKILALVLFFLGIALWFFNSKSYCTLGSDFVQDYFAAKVLVQGKSVYSQAVPEAAIQSENLSGFENFHPPFASLLYVPLTIFSFKDAQAIWHIIVLLCYIGTIYLSLQCVALTGRQQLIILGFALFWHPFIECVALAQSSALLALLLVVGWQSIRRGRSIFAGGVLGLACLIKLFPGLLLVYFILKKDLRALLSFVMVFMLGISACALILGTSDIFLYFTEVVGRDVREWSPFPVNYSVWGSVSPLLFNNPWVFAVLDDYSWLSLPVSIICSFIAVFIAWRKVAGGATDQAYLFLLVSALLCSPITWSHAFIIIIPALFYLWANLKYRRKAQFLMFAVFLLSLPSYEYVRFLQEYFDTNKFLWWQFLFTRTAFIGLVLVWLLLLAEEDKVESTKIDVRS